MNIHFFPSLQSSKGPQIFFLAFPPGTFVLHSFKPRIFRFFCLCCPHIFNKKKFLLTTVTDSIFSLFSLNLYFPCCSHLIHCLRIGSVEGGEYSYKKPFIPPITLLHAHISMPVTWRPLALAFVSLGRPCSAETRLMFVRPFAFLHVHTHSAFLVVNLSPLFSRSLGFFDATEICTKFFYSCLLTTFSIILS